MNNLLQNPAFINAVSFFIFLALAYHFGRKPALRWIDSEINKIRNELHTAHHLRAEAEAALADCKEKQKRAEAEAQSIIELAKKQVEVMRQKAEADLALSLARHQQLAAERIHLAEVQALTDVRLAAIDAAMMLARKSLADNLSEGDASRLIDQVIADIPGLKNSKPKAA